MQRQAIERGRKRGIALATALFLMVLMLVMGMGFLSASQRDLQFQRRQQIANQAQRLAESGVEYFRYRATKTPPDPIEYWQSPPDNPWVIDVSPTEKVEIEALDDMQTFTSKGIVYKSNLVDIAAIRTIVVYKDQISPTGGPKYDADL